jgi:DNA-binding MarR family transcriptional regulator
VSIRSGRGRRGEPGHAQAYEREVAAYTAAGGDESVQRIVTAISRLNRRLDILYRRHVADLHLNSGEWSVLTNLVLEAVAGTVTTSALAELCGVSASAMTHRLDRMGERGLVERSPDPANRTRSLVRLTTRGRELFREGVLQYNVVEANLLQPLSATERSTLSTLLEKLIAATPAR